MRSLTEKFVPARRVGAPDNHNDRATPPSELEPDRYGYCHGTALNSLKRFTESLPILLSQATKHQPDAMSWFQVAIAREGIRDIEGCKDAYRRALELDPDYATAMFNLGGIL